MHKDLYIPSPHICKDIHICTLGFVFICLPCYSNYWEISYTKVPKLSNIIFLKVSVKTVVPYDLCAKFLGIL